MIHISGKAKDLFWDVEMGDVVSQNFAQSGSRRF